MRIDKDKKVFLEVLKGNKSDYIPFWFMRQAGRYLPEYRDLRSKSNEFLDLVYNPKKACEITMQPIRRFEMDAAILFSDILVIPHALGQELDFIEGKGPKLNPLRNISNILSLEFTKFDEILNPIYETISNTKFSLKSEGYNSTTLIGFCGAPWTVACYMIEGGGSKDFIETKKFIYTQEKIFEKLIDILVEASAKYLIGQIKSGVEVIQIFDSWAGILDAQNFHKWIIEPTIRIIDIVRSVYPNVPIIGFPRMVGSNYLDYVLETGINAVSIDSSVNTKWAAKALQPHVTVQGNLDPICLLAGGDILLQSVEEIVENLKDGNFIFNLGHGIHKDTPIEHVEMLVKLLKNRKY